MKKFFSSIAAFLAIGFASLSANAAVINGYDTSAFDFDVSAFNATSATGTSGGIGWTLTTSSIWAPLSITNGTAAFTALDGKLTDSLHLSRDFTITFDQPIDKLFVVVSNNDKLDAPNFGLVPTFTQGITVNGTQLNLNSLAGGVVIYEGINSLTFTNTNNNGVLDGYNLAFHAVAAVPEPETYALMLAGIAAVGFVARRRKG